MSETTEIFLNVEGRKLAALQSNCGSQHRILCIHGWLDNANSFKPLLPLIQNAELVALDLPGHGHSDHQQTIYSLATEAHTVIAAANALQWDSFILVGHSLGGCIAPFATVAAKERIEKLVLIEAAGPRSEPSKSLPARLVKFHQDMSTPNKYQSRLFDSVEQAIKSRLWANKMTYESAKLIVERQLQEIHTDGAVKWQWRFDSKLRITSPSYFTEDQVQSVLATVDCPVLCILADKGYITDRKETDARLKKIKDLTLKKLNGHHHLHLDNPQAVADVINQFLN